MSLRKNIRSKKYFEELVNKIQPKLENPQSEIRSRYGRIEFDNLEADYKALGGTTGKKPYEVSFVTDLERLIKETPDVPVPIIDITDLWAYYRFDGNRSDSSGNGRNLGEFGSSDYVTGKVGSAYYKDNNNDRIQRGSGPALGTNFTISFWVNHRTFSSGKLFSQPGFSGNSLTINLESTGFLSVNFDRNTSGTDYFGSDLIQLSTNQWNHIVVSYDGTTLKLYRNGSLVSTATPPSYSIPAADYRVLSNDSLRVYIDEYSIWTRTLSQEEISTIYTANNAGLALIN